MLIWCCCNWFLSLWRLNSVIIMVVLSITTTFNFPSFLKDVRPFVRQLTTKQIQLFCIHKLSNSHFGNWISNFRMLFFVIYSAINFTFSINLLRYQIKTNATFLQNKNKRNQNKINEIRSLNKQMWPWINLKLGIMKMYEICCQFFGSRQLQINPMNLTLQW